MPREHGKSGEYVETVTLADALDTFDHVDGPVILSADVADRLGCSRETARRKLETLHDRGDLDRRKVSRRVIYWRPSRGEDAATTAGASDATEPTPEPRNAESGPTRDESDADPVDAALADLDTSDDRRDAVRACIEYLREHGTGQRSDFLDAVYPDHPAGFGSEGGWWNKIGKEFLQAVAEDYDPLTPPAGEGSHTWRFDP